MGRKYLEGRGGDFRIEGILTKKDVSMWMFFGVLCKSP